MLARITCKELELVLEEELVTLLRLTSFVDQAVAASIISAWAVQTQHATSINEQLFEVFPGVLIKDCTLHIRVQHKVGFNVVIWIAIVWSNIFEVFWFCISVVVHSLGIFTVGDFTETKRAVLEFLVCHVSLNPHVRVVIIIVWHGLCKLNFSLVVISDLGWGGHWLVF